MKLKAFIEKFKEELTIFEESDNSKVMNDQSNLEWANQFLKYISNGRLEARSQSKEQYIKIVLADHINIAKLRHKASDDKVYIYKATLSFKNDTFTIYDHLFTEEKE